MKIDVVSASAGTGKTWRLGRVLADALLDGSAAPEGVVAITYTKRAAAELESRIRTVLLERGEPGLAARVRDGYLGTIHAVCQRLLREFALEAGLSPFLAPLPDSERVGLFDRALAGVVAGREAEVNALAARLAIDDWKEPLREMVDAARENGMGWAEIAHAAGESRRTLDALLPAPTIALSAWRERLGKEAQRVESAVRAEAEASPSNAAARERAAAAARMLNAIRAGRLPPWKEQLDLARAVTAKKLASAAGGLLELTGRHLECDGFQDDLRAMQRALFDLAGGALEEFAREKAEARVVDFGDMLALANGLLEAPGAAAALRERLDLVLVDEFQDTSPLQLAFAAGLARLARRSVWVGDRKQSIYAFQGSDPELMAGAVAHALGGAEPEVLSTSYRSRRLSSPSPPSSSPRRSPSTASRSGRSGSSRTAPIPSRWPPRPRSRPGAGTPRGSSGTGRRSRPARPAP